MKDKVVIITGASQGIGKATVKAFSQAGARVVLASRNKQTLDAIAKTLPGESLVIPTDITKEKDVIRLCKDTVKKFGKIDIFINNAGALQHKDVADTSLEEWRAVIEPNLTGVYLCTREAIPYLRKTKGHIITVSSILAFLTLSGKSSYCASKHAVTSLMTGVRREVKKDGIKVTTIHPAGINTVMLKGITASRKIGSVLEPEDIGNYLVAVASRSMLQKAIARTILLGKRFYSLVPK